MSRRIDLSGMKFGRLLVVERGENKCGLSTFICVCDCGNLAKVLGKLLRNGHTRSCGCLRSQKTREANTTHGCRWTREYNSWRGMIKRCTNSKLKQYSDYGGRGITVCERWFSFENFLADMGSCSKGFSIDRINNNGNYEPGNCRWTDRITQANNKRNNRIFEREGQKKTLAEWTRETGFKSSAVINGRMKLGWTLDRIVSTPVGKYVKGESNNG